MKTINKYFWKFYCSVKELIKNNVLQWRDTCNLCPWWHVKFKMCQQWYNLVADKQIYPVKLFRALILKSLIYLMSNLRNSSLCMKWETKFTSILVLHYFWLYNFQNLMFTRYTGAFLLTHHLAIVWKIINQNSSFTYLRSLLWNLVARLFKVLEWSILTKRSIQTVSKSKLL